MSKQNFGAVWSAYYEAKGSYRKAVMKRETLTLAGMYDMLSMLEVRIDRMVDLPEMVENVQLATDMLTLRDDIKEYARVLRNERASLDEFCEDYDALGSIVDGMECTLCTTLNSFTGKLSEDAALIQRQAHWQKDQVPDSARSRSAKMAWRTNKNRYKAAIQKFHKSTAGKTFHRNLARFNRRKGSMSENDVLDLSKGLSSCLTHLIAEVQQYEAAKAECTMVESTEVLREVFQIFNAMLLCTTESYFCKDATAVADVLEVLDDFYGMELPV